MLVLLLAAAALVAPASGRVLVRVTCSGMRSQAGTSNLRLRVVRTAAVARSYKATLTVSITPTAGRTTRVTKTLRVRR